MKYKSYRLLCLVITVLISACSYSDWERQQMSPDSPVSFVAENSGGEGFVVREGLFVASTDKLVTILDSGTSYPFELYLSGDGYVTKFEGKTPAWFNPHGIMLVSDLEQLFLLNPELRRDFSHSNLMTIVILNDATKRELFRLEAMTRGGEEVFKM